MYLHSRYLHYKDLKFDCSTTGGAECPAELIGYNDNADNKKTGKFYTYDHYFIDYKIPKFPAKSTITVTITFTPTHVTSDISTCGNITFNNNISLHQATIRVPSNVSETNDDNDRYIGYDADSPNSFQRISRGQIASVTMPNLEQLSDVCKRTGVSVEVRHNNELPYKFYNPDKEFEYDIIYKNT